MLAPLTTPPPPETPAPLVPLAPLQDVAVLPPLTALLRMPQVLALVAASGATESHVVGGTLRDAILGLAVHDLDVVVAGRGGVIADELAARLPARLVKLGGKEFAAYRLIGPDGMVVDLWDREGMSLRDDLERRDFTVNSLALDARTGALADPFGGLADLRDRVLRATTDRSFTGDPLRVLRLARLGLGLPRFVVAPATLDLARRSVPGLAEVAAERIREELWQVLSHEKAELGLRALADLGVYPALWLRSPALEPRPPYPGPLPPAFEPLPPALGARTPGGSGATQNALADDAANHAQDLAMDGAVDLAAGEIAALADRARELETWLTAHAPAAAPGGGRAGGTAAAGAAQAPGARAAVAALDVVSARFAATCRYLEASEEPAGGAAPVDLQGSLGATAMAPPAPGAPLRSLARLRAAGYLTARQAAAIEPLAAGCAVLPSSEIERRRFIHRHGRRWLTVACSCGAAATVRGAAALAEWRRRAEPLCALASRAGEALMAPPRLLTGEDVQGLLGLPPGPRIGEALGALTAAQVDGEVRSRAEAAAFLRGWVSARRWPACP
jgi:hypothetical protein